MLSNMQYICNIFCAELFCYKFQHCLFIFQQGYRNLQKFCFYRFFNCNYAFPNQKHLDDYGGVSTLS